MMPHLLITGGCGFIGSNLAVALRRAGHTVTCLDNLARRGSEVLLRRILDHGCQFVHGDVRNPEDLQRLQGDFHMMIECSAEPSVLVGSQGRDAAFLTANNLGGSLTCAEFVRQRGMGMLFLSTSRVYPYTLLNALRYRETATRFEYDDQHPGVSDAGVRVEFPLEGRRTLYGATKLASELVLQEYSQLYDLPLVINRCGVVAGPWQLGKVDQGVFTFWMARHYFRQPLRYIGFGGAGKQVRDLLHIDDLVALISTQLQRLSEFRGEVFNVGGSTYANLSLLETTLLCREITGNRLDVGSDPQTRPGDVKWFITDTAATEARFGWRPARGPREVLADTFEWLRSHEHAFREVLGAA
ncbi:MAG: NAD-dependent epimerase/dehydratase family protein [Armatimonadota bacterium]|nr:NAD-dependent epimerase/dehydratase family protein [Armatimonadota bacterium]